MMPIALFAFLDAYYLSLEKRFRDHYNAFIARVHSGTAVVTDLYIVTPGKGAKIFWSCLGEAFFSLAVWPFYGLLAGFVLIAQRWFLS